MCITKTFTALLKKKKEYFTRIPLLRWYNSFVVCIERWPCSRNTIYKQLIIITICSGAKVLTSNTEKENQILSKQIQKI